jgi:hypothetical protein
MTAHASLCNLVNGMNYICFDLSVSSIDVPFEAMTFTIVTGEE